MSDFSVVRIDETPKDDKTWAASAHAFDTGRSVTLDLTAFTKATHYKDGYVPSGTPLTRDAGTGKWEPTAAAGTFDGILLEPVAVRDGQTVAAAAVIDHGVIYGDRLRGAAADITPADTTQFVVR